MRRILFIALSIFFCIWGVITLTINESDAQAFRMQNATIAALVNRHTFTLKELEVPDFRLVVGQETFRISEDIYPMKQPGQTIWGAPVYTILKSMGITYEVHYLWASSMITMLTTASLVALTGIVIFFLVLKETSNIKASVIAAFATTLGTNLWVYGGVTHHDAMAVFFVALSLIYFNNKKWVLSGISAGVTTLFSMLPLPILLATYIAARKERLRVFWGLAIGAVPFALFNTIVFGKPWLPPNIAGEVSDTVPLLSLTNFVQKIWFYLGDPNTAFWAFSPILILAIYAIYRNRKSNNSFYFLLTIAPIFQLLYVSTIETYGGHQYGPRYLLPTIPYLGVGIGMWLDEAKKGWWKQLTVILLIYSFAVSLIGSLMTAMYPLDEGYAPFSLVSKVISLDLPVFRVWKYGMVLILIGALLAAGLVISTRQLKKKLEL